MDTDELLKNATGLLALAESPEGPDTKDQTIQMAQGYALLALTQELKRQNDFAEYAWAGATPLPSRGIIND